MKKILKVSILCIAIMVCLIGCSSGNSNLSSKEKALLKRSYSSLTSDEQVALVDIEYKMSEDDKKKYEGQLRRLYIEHNVSLGLSSEESEKLWNSSKNYDERKAKGQLTDEEKSKEKQYEKNAEDFNNNVAKYLEAEKKIQSNIDSTMLKDEKINKYINKITIESEPNDNGFSAVVNLYRPYSIKIGEVHSIRNAIVDNMQKVIKTEKVEVEFVNGEKSLDEYVFTASGGWDKEATVWK